MSSGRMPRHALGLPAGSVRALLAFTILGMLWLMMYAATKTNKVSIAFLYLQMLMLMILAHYFVAHGRNMGREVSDRSPLGLPRGSVRFLLILGFGGLAAFMWWQHRQQPLQFPETARVVPFLGMLLGGFILGFLMTGFFTWLGGGTLPFWVQDVQAWLALLSLCGLVVLTIIHVFINPGVPPEQQIVSTNVEAGLAAVVGLYFGARS